MIVYACPNRHEFSHKIGICSKCSRIYDYFTCILSGNAEAPKSAKRVLPVVGGMRIDVANLGYIPTEVIEYRRDKVPMVPNGMGIAFGYTDDFKFFYANGPFCLVFR